MIACVLVRQFAVTVERRERPVLASKALILTRLHGNHERVYAASVDAEGVQVGMKLTQAQALCPAAECIPAATSRFRDALAQLAQTLSVFSDRLEVEDDVQRDVAVYLDLGRLTTADLTQMGKHIGASCAQLHLPVTVGIAEGKFTALVAATYSQALRIIPAGAEATFLAPLPVTLLPLDSELARQLWLLGIERLGQFAALPKGAVLAQFGKRGRLLRELASGRDGRLLRPYVPTARERAARRFPAPVENRQPLGHALAELASELAQRLERGGVGTQELILLLHQEDGTLQERVLRLRQPISQAASLRLVLGRALESATDHRPNHDSRNSGGMSGDSAAAAALAVRVWRAAAAPARTDCAAVDKALRGWGLLSQRAGRASQPAAAAPLPAGED